MSLITLLLALALLGLVAWALITFIPMPSNMAKLIAVVAVVAGILYVLTWFGVGVPIKVPPIK